MKRLVLSLLLLCSAFAFGQGATVSFPPVTGPNGQSVPFASLHFCTTPTVVTAGVCSTPITVYQNITLTTPYSSAIQTDGLGNVPVVYFPPAANYCVSISGSNSATNTCYPFSVGYVSGSSPTFTNMVVTGTLGVSGVSTLSGGVFTPNFENIRFADQFAGATVTNKIDAAFTDLAGNPGLVVIPSNVGSGLPTSIPKTGVMLDLRNNGVSPGTGFGIMRTFAPSVSGQVLGLVLEQGLNPSVDQAFLNFGQATELFTFAGNTHNFSGSNQSVYGSFSHFGSGTTNGIYGGAFEAFNSGPATALLVVGVNSTANNGGVNAGVPIQTATNNGNATVLRAFDGIASNLSSGTVTNAVNFYAEGIRNTGGGSITNGYGVLVADITGASTNTAIQTGLGKVSFGDAVTANTYLGVGATAISIAGILENNSNLTGANQIGILSAPSCNSASVNECEGVRARFDTSAAAFTTTLGQAFHVVSGIKGAGSAITTEVGVDIDTLSNGGTQFALRTGANTSQFGGQVQSTVTTGTPPLIIASTTVVPNLNVQVIKGVTVSNTPTTGQALIATSASGANWQAVGGSFSCVNVTPVTVSANTSADQILQACSIPAGTLNTIGKTISIQSAGVYSTPAASTSTVNLKVKLCTVSGCGSGTVITLASLTSAALGAIQATNDPWNLQTFSSTQTAGASAAFEAHGNLTIDISALATAAEGVYADGNTATVGTIDSTAALFLQVTGAFSAASASNSMTHRMLTIESIN